mgnify:CR=1 FL=1
MKTVQNLAINTALAIGALSILTWVLVTLGLYESFTLSTYLYTTTLFLVAAAVSAAIRYGYARRLGYNYTFSQNPLYALLSFVLTARLYGVIPLLYLGETQLSVNQGTRIGTPEIGVNHKDLADTALAPLQLYTVLAPIFLVTGYTFPSLLLTAYNMFSLIPYPYSDGMHILSYDASSWRFFAALNSALFITTTLLVAF